MKDWRLEQIKQIRAYGLRAEPTALLLAIDDLLAEVATHEPASPAAQPELCGVCAHPKHEGKCSATLTHDVDTLCPCVMAVAQSGAGGPINPFDMLKLDKIRMRAEEGYDISYNDVLYLIHGISKLLNPSTRPSSPSGQAAAPTPHKEMLEAIAEDGLLVTWDKDYKFNFSQVVRLMVEFAMEHHQEAQTIGDAASPTGGEPPQWANRTYNSVTGEFDAPAAEPNAEQWPSDLPADGIGAMNLLTNFWTGDLKGLTKEGARIVDSLVAHVTKGLLEQLAVIEAAWTADLKQHGEEHKELRDEAANLRAELAESNHLLELANAPEKALEDALTVAEGLRAERDTAQAWSNKWEGLSAAQEKTVESLREKLERTQEVTRNAVTQAGLDRTSREAAEVQLATAREALRRLANTKHCSCRLDDGIHASTCSVAIAEAALAPAKEPK